VKQGCPSALPAGALPCASQPCPSDPAAAAQSLSTKLSANSSVPQPLERPSVSIRPEPPVPTPAAPCSPLRSNDADFDIRRVHLPAPGAVAPCNARIPVTLVKLRRARSACASPSATAAGTAPSAPLSPRARRRQRSKSKDEKLPVVLWLHATSASAAAMMPRLLAYAELGFLAAAIDCRYHGERAAGGAGRECRSGYQDAVYQCVPLAPHHDGKSARSPGNRRARTQRDLCIISH
jgi:hypothetical protein